MNYITKTIRQISLAVLLIQSSNLLYARVVIRGDAEDPQITFKIPRSCICMRNDGAIVTGAAQRGAGAYAISHYNQRTGICDGIMKKNEITFNDTPESDNPLFDAAIQHLALAPTATLSLITPFFAIAADTPSTAYYMESPQHLLSCPINDSQGKETSGVIAFGGSSLGRAFAAVLPHEGTFGQPGTGITVIGIQKAAAKKTNEKGEVQEIIKSELKSLYKAIPLDLQTPAAYFGTSLSDLQPPITFWWDYDWATRSPLKAMSTFVYIGIGSVISGSSDTDVNGAASVIMGLNYETNRLFHFFSIFDEKADFSDAGTDKIIVATGKQVSLSIHHLKTIWTSTDMRYLIVVGGNGVPDETSQSVFALPLVFVGAQDGRLANKYDNRRTALRSDELVSNTEPAAIVGGGPLSAGPIAQLELRNDLVYAVVTQGEHAGIYGSRPIFSSHGLIDHWTTWQRIGENVDGMTAAALSLFDGSWYTFHKKDGLLNTVQATRWSSGDASSSGPIIEAVNKIYKNANTIIQGITPFRLHCTTQSPVPLVGTYGGNIVALAHMSSYPDEHAVVTYRGGSLDEIKPLTSMTLGVAVSDAWIIAAGMHGVKILQHDDGSGFGNVQTDQLSNMTANMSWHQLGSSVTKNIKKLSCDNEYLYIVTDTTIDRIDLSQQSRPACTIATLKTIQATNKYDHFTDLLVSDSVALLTATNGLYTIAPGSSITDQQPIWTRVLLPEQQFPVTQIHAVTTTGIDTDVARYGGGNVYIVSGNQASNCTVVHRLVIAPTEGQPVASNTVLPFVVDDFAPDVASYCLNYGTPQQMFALDGAVVYAVNNSKAESLLSVPFFSYAFSSLLYTLRSHHRFGGALMHHITYGTTALISCLAKHTVSGAWMVGTHEGIYINE